MTSTVGGMPRWAAACGVLYALTYVVGNDVVAAALYPGYSRTDQAISELSATAAPTQAFLTAVLPLETLLLLGFGLGVWSTARGDRALRWTGGLLVAAALIGPLWLLFPMTSRQDITAAAVPVSDVGHLALTAVTVLLIVMIILTGTGTGTGTVAVRDRRFRIYSAVTLVAVPASGVVTGVLASKIPDGLPTSGMGLFERVNAYGYMVWLAVFAIVLARAKVRPRDSGAAPRVAKRPLPRVRIASRLPSSAGVPSVDHEGPVVRRHVPPHGRGPRARTDEPRAAVRPKDPRPGRAGEGRRAR